MTIGFATTRNCNEDFPRVEQFGAPSERERERERGREDQRSHVSAWDKLRNRACACDFIHLASYRSV